MTVRLILTRSLLGEKKEGAKEALFTRDRESRKKCRNNVVYVLRALPFFLTKPNLLFHGCILRMKGGRTR